MKLKIIKYSCALLIGVALICIAVFDNVHYASFRGKALIMGAGLVIVAMGIYRIAALLKSTEPGKNKLNKKNRSK